MRKLIAGPGVYICDECIDLCNEILDEELIEARWFRRDEVRDMAENQDILPPAQYSISRWLIDCWLKEKY